MSGSILGFLILPDQTDNLRDGVAPFGGDSDRSAHRSEHGSKNRHRLTEAKTGRFQLCRELIQFFVDALFATWIKLGRERCDAKGAPTRLIY